MVQQSQRVLSATGEWTKPKDEMEQPLVKVLLPGMADIDNTIFQSADQYPATRPVILPMTSYERCLGDCNAVLLTLFLVVRARIPNIKMLFCTDNSILRFQQGFNFSSTGCELGHPNFMNWWACDNNGSQAVAIFSDSRVRGSKSIWLRERMLNLKYQLHRSPGKRDNISALLYSPVGLKMTSYKYADKIIAHRCNLAAARVGTPFFGPKITVNGL